MSTLNSANAKPTDPLAQLREWNEDAKKTPLQNPNAFVLSTVDATGTPHARVVLMKDLRPEGIVFYTNYESRKGEDLAHESRCSALFYWDPLFRQVHVVGQAEKLPRADAEAYWATRPRGSQLSQWVSRQSQPLADRNIMAEEVNKADDQFGSKPIPCPPHWGGYIIRPTYVEFWTGRENRFHDRIAYRKVGEGWRSARLYP